MVVLFVHCIKKNKPPTKDGFLNRLPLLPIPFAIANLTKVICCCRMTKSSFMLYDIKKHPPFMNLFPLPLFPRYKPK